MRLLLIPSILVLLAAPAAAQIGNPAGVAPDTPQTAPGAPDPSHTNAQDQLFGQLAGAGGHAEVALGRLAERRSKSDAVREFGRRMVEDHGKANAKLAAAGRNARLAIPAEPDAEQKAALGRIEKLSGERFDRAYIDRQVQDHQKTVQLLLWEIGSGQNAELQHFASEAVPVVLEHLRIALDLAADLAAETAPEPRELPKQKPATGRGDPPRPTR